MNIFSHNISSFFLSIALAMLFVIQSSAQNPFAGFTARENERLRGGAGHFNQAKGDSIDPNSVPTGYFMWNVDESFGAVRPVRPEAGFLVWLDCRRLGLNHEQLLDLFVDKAHLALNDGEMFGTGGAGFMRLNVGTPRAVLEQAMRQLAEAIAQL